MSDKDAFKRRITERLLNKFYRKDPSSSRRPSIDPASLYRAYRRNTCDIFLKQALEDAAGELEHMGFVQVDFERGLDEIRKIYLDLERAEEFEEYAAGLGIKTRGEVSLATNSLFAEYEQAAGGKLKEHVDVVMKRAKTSPQAVDLKLERKKLKAAAWLLENDKPVFEREASMFIYGDSKTLEKMRSPILTICGAESLEDMNVKRADSIIHIRGDAELHVGGEVLRTRALSGGFGISSDDIHGLEKVVVNAGKVLTIENKTSFCRYLPEDTVSVYLDGFANNRQIAFMKTLVRDNPGIGLQHFGDIDVGGFLILQHLEKGVGERIRPHYMGEDVLDKVRKSRYDYCLQHLSDWDRDRMKFVSERFSAVKEYMLRYGVKLEQEIVSYLLSCGSI